VLNGIFFVQRTGTPWHDLPERYGPDMTASNRFNRWVKKGHLAAHIRDLGSRVAALPTHRHALRQNRPQPPCRRPVCRLSPVDQV
jgi:transposase